ncbi:MAG: hypothetical protein N2A42_04425, partial [Luteolibacter sp.]
GGEKSQLSAEASDLRGSVFCASEWVIEAEALAAMKSGEGEATESHHYLAEIRAFDGGRAGGESSKL